MTGLGDVLAVVEADGDRVLGRLRDRCQKSQAGMLSPARPLGDARREVLRGVRPGAHEVEQRRPGRRDAEVARVDDPAVSDGPPGHVVADAERREPHDANSKRVATLVWR